MVHNFAAFILTHGRPDNVKTYKSLRRFGYTGPIVLIVDDLDESLPQYQKNFGEEVYVFDKRKSASESDSFDNKPGLGTVLYARNVCHQIAAELGYEFFVQLDDDYHMFEYRFKSDLTYVYAGPIQSMDKIFEAFVDFLKESPALTITMAQGGDFIGGKGNQNAKSIRLSRKAMNTFFCATDRPFKFVGRLNDDVNTYLQAARLGDLMFTANQVSIIQGNTQQHAGGLTEAYLKHGTYVKSFYSVISSPSSVVVSAMGDHQYRLHHRIDWKSTAPKIIREEIRKRE